MDPILETDSGPFLETDPDPIQQTDSDPIRETDPDSQHPYHLVQLRIPDHSIVPLFLYDLLTLYDSRTDCVFLPFAQIFLILPKGELFGPHVNSLWGLLRKKMTALRGLRLKKNF